MICKNCGKETATRIVRNINSAGVSMTWVQCLTCGKNARGSGQWLKKPSNVEELPVIENFSTNYTCEVCGHTGAEVHHWAPRFIFGNEADQWPTGYLCPTCHAYWHDKINKARG